MTFLDYAARGKNNWWRYILGCVFAVVIAMLLAILLLIPPIIMHWVPADIAQQMQSPAHPVVFYIANGISFGVFLLGLIATAAIFNKKRFGDVIGKWRWPHLAIGAGAWLVLIVACTAIDLALQPHGFTFTAASLTPGVVIAAIAGLGIQTFTEEFIFRGYITQGLLLATKNPLLAAILSGIVFGACHIPNGIPQAVSAGIFGVAVAWLAIRTGGLAMGYGIHLINNLFAALVIVSTDDVFKGTPAIFTQHTPGLMWVDVVSGSIAIAALAWVVGRRKAP